MQIETQWLLWSSKGKHVFKYVACSDIADTR